MKVTRELSANAPKSSHLSSAMNKTRRPAERAAVARNQEALCEPRGTNTAVSTNFRRYRRYCGNVGSSSPRIHATTQGAVVTRTCFVEPCKSYKPWSKLLICIYVYTYPGPGSPSVGTLYDSYVLRLQGVLTLFHTARHD